MFSQNRVPQFFRLLLVIISTAAAPSRYLTSVSSCCCRVTPLRKCSFDFSQLICRSPRPDTIVFGYDNRRAFTSFQVFLIYGEGDYLLVKVSRVWACSARWNERAANRSCSSRRDDEFFSNVFTRPAHGLDTIARSGVLGNEFALLRVLLCQGCGLHQFCVGVRRGDDIYFSDMLSTPTARPTSIWPLRIWFAMVVMAISPLEQNLLMH